MDSKNVADQTNEEFQQQSTGAGFPQNEERIMKLWREKGTYQKSLERRRAKNKGTFVFFEGPPTANGLPHPGHCLTRAIKDLYPRYKSMKGYLCERKAGWDTHGLPVEVEVCKELGIHSKEEIEEFGVEPFIHRCIENVFRYTREWEELTERLGFWINLNEAYVTFHKSYVESVWFALKNLFDRGLLYQGHKIVWWWAQGGTALSSGEVGQGYRQVADPSIFVRFPLVGEENDPIFNQTDLIVWTTTPWTLPSNQFAAVHPDLDYAVVTLTDADGNVEPVKVVIAAALVDAVAAKVKKTAKVIATVSGKELIGKRYRPPFDYYYKTLGDKTGTLKTGETEYLAWRVCPADFVTTESGTGLVHEAPAFGEVDFDLLVSERDRFQPGEGPELICAVASNGCFTEVVPEFQGRWVKECDREIRQILKERGILFHQEQYLHDYPFCWRAPDDPLIQYPRKSWFIRTTQFKDKMLENNSKINWMPEHIKDGRFGNFLEANVDWALSRERYWGTPLPIWVCEETGYMEAIASYDELLGKPDVRGTDVWENARNKAKADAGTNWSRKEEEIWNHLKVHKPYIDAVTYESPKAPGKRMRRVPEVIDCWFDSGSMPFAQWGYPHKKGAVENFEKHFPADFISEAIDQTRGWFYSQLAISTMLFSGDENADNRQKSGNNEAIEYPHPFRNCIVLGLMLAEWYESNDGKQRFLLESDAKVACGKAYAKKIGKMSKSLRNYRSPKEIFDKYGADALRWYFFANQVPWNSIIYSESAIRDSMPEFMIRLWNVCTFFDVYQKIDGFAPETLISASPLSADGGMLTSKLLQSAVNYHNIAERAELDRWIMSELNQTVQFVNNRMDHFDHYAACEKLTQFVDSLSNWYVRRSRDRFWSGEESKSKADAYWTLYESLLTLAKLIAPFVPYLAERIWQQLAVEPFGEKVLESVHLCDYPVADESAIDSDLSRQMGTVREIVSLGRNARLGAKLKVRQPLSAIEVVLADPSLKEELLPQVGLIKEELNVKEVHFIEKADQYISYSVLPDFKKLGPKLGKQLPQVRQALGKADGATLLAELEQTGKITISLSGGTVELSSDEIQIRLQAKEGFAAAQGTGVVVVLATELTEDLIAEGRARELVRLIQDQRKEMNCEYTARIVVGIHTESVKILKALADYAEYIQSETLTTELKMELLPDLTPIDAKIDGEELQLTIGNVTR